MDYRKNFSNAALATAAAMLFSTAPLVTHAADAAKTRCDGGNACKGKSECSTATSSCSGQNSCKGKGFVTLSKSDCSAAQAANRPDKKS
jgi:hypothetical protein